MYLPSSDCCVCNPPETKKRKIDKQIESSSNSNPEEWLHLKSHSLKLTIEDKVAIEQQNELNDKHVNFAQAILKSQFPDVDGLCCTLFQDRVKLSCSSRLSVQIIHVYGNYWITISNVNCPSGEVRVYDSIYSSVSKDVEDLIYKLFDRKVQIINYLARNSRVSKIVVCLPLPQLRLC